MSLRPVTSAVECWCCRPSVLRRTSARIQRLNPPVNAICSLNPSLPWENLKTQSLDQNLEKCNCSCPDCTFSNRQRKLDTLRSGSKRPFENVPFLVKDCLNTEPTWPTTAGSRLLQNRRIGDTSPLVTQLVNDGGAIAVAKTNTSEFCADIQSFNPLYGQTNNPFDPQLTSGGSSGGSAAAVSVQITPFALGSDMAGSLRIPAAFCGTYSLRPSPGRIDRGGMVPPPFSAEDEFIAVGFIAKNTTWLQKVFNFCQIDEKQVRQKYLSNPASQRLQLKAGGSIRLAISPSFLEIETDYRIIESFSSLFETFAKSHPEFPTFECTEVKSTENFLPPSEEMKKLYTKLAIVDQESLLGSDESLTQEGIEKSKLLREKKKEKYDQDLKKQKEVQQKFEELFFSKFDFWLLPVCPSLPFPHNPERKKIQILLKEPNKSNITPFEMSYWKTISYCSPITTLGNPVVSLPIGWTLPSSTNPIRLPVGAQLVARRGADEELLTCASFIESILFSRVSSHSIRSAL